MSSEIIDCITNYFVIVFQAAKSDHRIFLEYHQKLMANSSASPENQLDNDTLRGKKDFILCGNLDMPKCVSIMFNFVMSTFQFHVSLTKH